MEDTDQNGTIEKDLSSEEAASEERSPQRGAYQSRAIEQRGWGTIVRHFTPSWFSVNVGTGITSILLHQISNNGVWLYWISVVLFTFNVILFCLFLCLSILRYLIYPEIFILWARHPDQSLFVGLFPMGLSTIVNMIVYVCVPAWGKRAIELAWALWWIDVVISLSSCLGVYFVIMRCHTNIHVGTMTAASLMPILPTIVASASGGIVSEVLPNPQHALWTVIISYILWGLGVPLATVVMVTYFQRLTIHKLPPREVIVSAFIPLGPFGEGGFAIMQLGKVALNIFDKTRTLPAANGHAGEILYVMGLLTALLMWGFGIAWLFFALASVSAYSRFPFNIGWWGCTFPLGVFAVSSMTMGKELPSSFFTIIGTILSVTVTLLWIIISYKTLGSLISGKMPLPPYLERVDDVEELDDRCHANESI